MKMKKKEYILIGLILIICLITSFVSASVSCTTNSISATHKEDELPKSQTIHCTNSDPNNSVQVNKIGTYISTNPTTPFSIGAGEANKPIIITFESAPVGIYNYLLWFDDGSNPVSINLNVEEEITTGCRLIELPHTITFRLKQGETGASGEIKVKASTDCPELDFNVIEQTQMNKPMLVQNKGETDPGKEYSFTIGLDSEGVETGIIFVAAVFNCLQYVIIHRETGSTIADYLCADFILYQFFTVCEIAFQFNKSAFTA